MRNLLGVLLVAFAPTLVALGCSDTATTDEAADTTDAVPPCVAEPESCPLRDVAEEADFLVGAAIDSDWIQDPGYAQVLAREFNSVTAEREMKWGDVQPERGRFDFTAAEELVAFAEARDLEVRGHTLVWDQEYLDSTPDWVLEITDPEELRAVLREHFEAVLGHFGDSVDRWDVVNEPLDIGGTGLYTNHFRETLGDGYIDELFRLASEVSPETSLWLNEAAVEYNPAKAEALYDLVAGLVDREVPIDGVGLQGHLLAGAPEAGFLEALIKRFTELGLEVAITEIDVPVEDDTTAEYSEQAATYEQMVTECMAAGCSELTMWGVHDAQTWLDEFLGREDTNPLLFDDALAAKEAYASTKEAIAQGAR